MTQALHAAHDIIGLREEGVAQALHPDRVLPQGCQHLREGHKRLYAWVPGLIRHLLDGIVAGGLGVGLGPGHRFAHLPRISGGHQYLGQQRIGVQRDGREHLVQLLLGEDRVLGRDRVGLWCRVGGRYILCQHQAGRGTQIQDYRQNR
ncbi:hypothetical protein D3C78_493880 [compost metagenome]